MIEVYLSFSGNAREAAHYYADLFGAPAPYIMDWQQMPKGSEEDEFAAGTENLVAYANVKTEVGDIMMSDMEPGTTAAPNESMWINFSMKDQERLRQYFDAMAKDGEVLMPLEKTFFSPLYGQVKDKFGFHWMFMTY